MFEKDFTFLHIKPNQNCLKPIYGESENSISVVFLDSVKDKTILFGQEYNAYDI